MNFLEIAPYIIVPSAFMGIGIGVSVFYKILLQKRTDCKSKIRVEAREPHEKEDHNHRRFEESLWCDGKVDKGILKIFQAKVGQEEKNGQ